MEQLFIRFLNISISAGYLVLAVLLLRPLLKKAPKAISCFLWGLVGLRLCLPVSIPSVLSLIPSTQTVPADIMMDWTPAIDSGIDAVNAIVNPVIAGSFTPAPYASANPLQIWGFLAANLWVLGMVVMALYSVISYLCLRFRLREAVRLESNIWSCDRIGSPFLLGLFRPRIYLPSGISDDCKSYVIAHEQAHLKRKDHWWKPLGFVLLSVYWFSPLMWIGYICLCRDIEYACDEKVIRKLGVNSKAAYSEALLQCSVPRKMICACPVAFGENGVKGRIKSVLNYKKPAFWLVLIAVLVCIAVAVCFLTDPVDQTPLYGYQYETGVCHYSFVVSEEKETAENDLRYSINSQGNVYKDYGDGENELLGTLAPTSFSAEDLNSLLKAQGGPSLSLGDVQKSWMLSSSAQAKDAVFLQNSQGHSYIISFFTDGKVMNVFELTRTKEYTASDIFTDYQFRATVLEVHDGSFLAEPDDPTVLADKVSVQWTGDVRIGDRVLVTYDGMVQELYPPILLNVSSVVVEVSTLNEDLLSVYPQYAGLSTDKGLEVYVWKNGVWRCGLRSGSNREATRQELLSFGGGITLLEMSQILKCYDVIQSDISILYSYDPAFSGPAPTEPTQQEQDEIRRSLLVCVPGTQMAAQSAPAFEPLATYPLVVYAYQLGPGAWNFNILKNTGLCHTVLDLIDEPVYSTQDAIKVLEKHDLEGAVVPVVVYQNPISSYWYEVTPELTNTVRLLLGLDQVGYSHSSPVFPAQ